MIRDKRKDENYFHTFIEYQNKRIEQKKKKLLVCADEDKAYRINLSLIEYKMDLLFAQYSIGCNLDELYDLLFDAIDTAIVMPQIDYENILNMLSLAIILKENDNTTKLIKKFSNMIGSDRLLAFFSSYIINGKGEWEGNFIISEVYDILYKLEKSDNLCGVMEEYLSSWYSKHETASWYECDKSDFDVYVGYWSFESAAICRVLNIDDSKLKENIYYPVFG